jgi:chloramphenicol O-acetyltransferase
VELIRAVVREWSQANVLGQGQLLPWFEFPVHTKKHYYDPAQMWGKRSKENGRA